MINTNSCASLAGQIAQLCREPQLFAACVRRPIKAHTVLRVAQAAQCAAVAICGAAFVREAAAGKLMDLNEGEERARHFSLSCLPKQRQPLKLNRSHTLFVVCVCVSK